jgi:aminoglycoside phosphotransferase (APT) family kinase protein
VEVHGLLQARSPDSEAVSLVHGDFKIGNCLLDASGEVQAVLDWELATLGDPLADVGWLVVSWAAESMDAPRIVDPPSRFGSFPPADELVDAYAASSPWALNDLPFYVALAEWRWACIDIGIEKRFRSGQMGDRTIDLDLVDAEIDSRLTRAHGILTGART